MIVALDPGLNVGVAWVSEEGRLLEGRVMTLEAVAAIGLEAAASVVVGDGTGSDRLQERLRALGVDFEVVDERDTTFEARKLYYADHPVRGLARLFPPGLRSPDRTIDDYAAYAIALRYLASTRTASAIEP